jgi:hypothetical protein
MCPLKARQFFEPTRLQLALFPRIPISGALMVDKEIMMTAAPRRLGETARHEDLPCWDGLDNLAASVQLFQAMLEAAASYERLTQRVERRLRGVEKKEEIKRSVDEASGPPRSSGRNASSRPKKWRCSVLSNDFRQNSRAIFCKPGAVLRRPRLFGLGPVGAGWWSALSLARGRGDLEQATQNLPKTVNGRPSRCRFYFAV